VSVLDLTDDQVKMVGIPKVLNAVPHDPDDDAVLECAIEGKAGFIVSGDKDLLELNNSWH
jgi:putative PIN family toxin of toxin-antitoxin system